MTVLTTPEIVKASGGYFPKPLTVNQAAGLVGSLTAEHGKLDWKGLDVVEKGTAVGRGMAQWSYDRRSAYDRARANAIKAGQDPNSIDFQMKFFFDELRGVYDKNGASLIGYRQPGTLPSNWKGQDNPAAWADYWTGSLAEKRGYFMPKTPHKDKRVNFADQVFKVWTAPKPTAPAAAPGQPPQQKGFSIQDAMKWLPGGNKKKDQSFNTDKMSQDYGTYASAGKLSIQAKGRNKGETLGDIYRRMEQRKEGSGRAFLSSLVTSGQTGAGIDLSRFQNLGIQAAGSKYGARTFAISDARIGQINNIAWGAGAPF